VPDSDGVVPDDSVVQEGLLGVYSTRLHPEPACLDRTAGTGDL